MRRTKRIWEGPGEHTCGWMSEKSATLASVSCKPGASMMQQITVVTSRRMAYLINWNQVITCTIYTQLCVLLLIAYMILLAMEELHMLGQHWQIAQAAEPKQLKRRKVKTLSSLYFRFHQMSRNLCIVYNYTRLQCCPGRWWPPLLTTL